MTSTAGHCCRHCIRRRDRNSAISVVLYVRELIRPICRRDQTLPSVRNVRASSIATTGNTEHRYGADVAATQHPVVQSIAKNPEPPPNAAAGSSRKHAAACGAKNGAADPAPKSAPPRCRAVLAQSGAACRTKRPCARGLSAAARTRPHHRRGRRRAWRNRQDARPRRRILAGRSATHRRIADTGSGTAYLELWAVAAKRLTGESVRRYRRACRRRQALQRSGMDVEPVLRFPQTALSSHLAMGRQAGRRCRQSRSAYPAKGGVLCPPDLKCDGADEFRPDQSGIAARDVRFGRREPGPRHAHAGRGYRSRRRRA